MSIIMRDGKYINTDPSEEDKKAQEEYKKEKLFELGDKIRARRQEAEKVVEELDWERKKELQQAREDRVTVNHHTHKEKSTKVLLRAQTVLKKASAGWPARSDLREIYQEVNEAVIADNLNNHTKTFVKILSVLDTVIPLWTGEQMLQLHLFLVILVVNRFVRAKMPRLFLELFEFAVEFWLISLCV